MESDQNNITSDAQIGISIPGLNTSAGIKQCGNLEMYIELLQDVYGIIDKKCNEIEDFLTNGDLKNFTTTVHSLKTTCRMLGHQDLSDSFFELEKIGKEGSLTKAAVLTPAVLDGFRSLKPLLEPYSKKETADKIPFSSEEVTKLLAELEISTADFDVNRAEVIMEELLTYECEKELSDSFIKLSTLVNDLDYDEASALAAALKERIG
ncbi:MAG: hypothetical protein K6E85_00835 [Lachnospiraceae bacterium]|nr:hypothetical protein [Lachnospiraceae bacterium]